MLYFSVENMPTFERNEAGNRTGKGGQFTTTSRIDKALWSQIKAAGACNYLSDSDIEDFGQWDTEPGWRYTLKALVMAVKAGEGVRIDGVECKTIKELFDAIEDVPRKAAEGKERFEQAQAERRAAEGAKQADWDASHAYAIDGKTEVEHFEYSYFMIRHEHNQSSQYISMFSRIYVGRINGVDCTVVYHYTGGHDYSEVVRYYCTDPAAAGLTPVEQPEPGSLSETFKNFFGV